MFGFVIRFKFDKMYELTTVTTTVCISNCTKFSRRPNNVEGGFQKYVFNAHIH